MTTVFNSFGFKVLVENKRVRVNTDNVLLFLNYYI